QAEDGIRDFHVTGVQTCALPIFNADDVVFSFNRWLNPQHPYHPVNGGRYPFFRSSGLIRLISAIERVDDHTVDIVLNQPDSSFRSEERREGKGNDYNLTLCETTK